MNISLWFAGHRSLARLASTAGASLVLTLSAYVAAGPAPVLACCPSATAVVAVSASPSTVGAGGSVTVIVHLTNPVNGVTSAAICYSLPNGSPAPGCQGPQIGPDSIALSLASGTPLDGVWQGVVAVPPAAASGGWTVQFVDATAGGAFARFDQLGVFGPILAGGNFTVTGGTDITPPAISSPTISPSTAGVGGMVTISARITDASGVAAASIQTLPNTTTSECCVPMTLGSGTAVDGIWQVTLIPTVPGIYDLTLVAAQDAAGNFAQIGGPPPFLGSFTVSAKQDQSITFAPLTDKILGEPPFGVSATATSGLTVSFTALGPCSVAGSTVSLSGTGVCTITAMQGGNTSFNAAPNVSRSFNVLSAAQFAQGVIDAVSGMDLPAGATNSLTSKLQAFVASSTDGNQHAACGELGALVNYLNAQSGKQIPAAGAALLLADAARLAVAAGC